jgi:hypothetical protein
MGFWLILKLIPKLILGAVKPLLIDKVHTPADIPFLTALPLKPGSHLNTVFVPFYVSTHLNWYRLNTRISWPIAANFRGFSSDIHATRRAKLGIFCVSQ